MATSLHEPTRSHTSRLISATAALGNLTRILVEKNSMTVVETERALVIAVMTTARIEIAITSGRERNQRSGHVRDSWDSVRDPTPDHCSHSKESVDDYKRRTEAVRDKKGVQDSKGKKRRESSSHPARDRSSNCCECTQVNDDYTSVCMCVFECCVGA